MVVVTGEGEWCEEGGERGPMIDKIRSSPQHCCGFLLVYNIVHFLEFDQKHKNAKTCS